MKQLITVIVHGVIKQIFKLVGYFPKSNLIYFESFHGKQCSDNPKAIYDYLSIHHSDYQLVWGASKGYDKVFVTQSVPYVRRFSLRWFLLMPRAQAWVINTRTPLYLAKNHHTTYLQTWHGTPLKKIGLDIVDVQIPGYDTQSYQEAFRAESARWDYLLSPNKYCSKLFPEAFGYQGVLIEQGYPRNDLLVKFHEDQAYIDSLKANMGLSNTKKIILYAPTWREDQDFNRGTYSFDVVLDLERLSKTVGSDTVILVRMHYLVSETLDFSQYEGKIIDVSAYPEMSELLLVSDLLITDYSSSFVDYMVTERPIIFYLYDRESYEGELRGLYVSVETTFPGVVVTDQSELLKQISHYLEKPDQQIPSEYRTIYQEFNQLEKGIAAKTAAKLIMESKRTVK